MFYILYAIATALLMYVSYRFGVDRTIKRIDPIIKKSILDSYNAGTKDFKNAIIELLRNIFGNEANNLIDVIEDGYRKLEEKDL